MANDESNTSFPAPQDQHISDMLTGLGVPWAWCYGDELEADLDATGHYSYKINSCSGLWFGPDGRKGNAESLARILSEKIGYVEVGLVSLEPSPDAATIELEKIRAGRAAWDRGLPWKAAPQWMRDAYLAYMSSRGFDYCDWSHLLHGFYESVRFGHVEPLANDAHLVVLHAMRSIGEDGGLGDVGGVQRLYLRKDGTKGHRGQDGPSRAITGRLVRHFVYLPPQPKIRDVLGDNFATARLAFIGEGFETCLALNASTGHAAIAAISANNLQCVAKLVAEDADLVPILAADRDKSMTGQNAAARAVWALHAQGHKAYFCMPQLSVRGGEKGADWADALKESGHTCTMIEVAAAMKAGPADLEAIATWRNHGRTLRKAQSRPDRLPADPGTLDQAMASVAQLFSPDAIAALEQAQDKRIMAQVDVGVGKSSAILGYIGHKRSGPPVLVMAPSRAFIAGYAQKALEVHGRNNPEADKSRGLALCFMYGDIASIARKNHTLVPTLCIRCKHGLGFLISRGRASSSDIEKAGFTPQDIKESVPCVYLPHVAAAREKPILTTVTQGYNANIARRWYPKGSNMPPDNRVVIIDEKPDMVKAVQVTVDDILEWRSFWPDEIAELKEKIRICKGDDSVGLEQQLNNLEAIREAFSMLAAHMVATEGTRHLNDCPRLADAMRSVVELAGARVTAPWEAVRTNKGRQERTPMRAAMAFAWTLQSGAGFINDGQLTVFEPTAIGQRILTPSLVSIMADATPPPELLSVVPNKLHMRVAQKVRIIRKASRMYGYGDLKPGVIRGNRQRGELLKRRYEHVIKHHLGLDPKAVFLMHRPTFDELGHLVPEGNAGYWGMDHRAHNRWAGKKTLVLLGNFYTPPHDMLQAWEAARAFALAGGASQEDWPVWDGSMAKTAWVREGAWEVRSWLPMPTNEKARQYFLLLARAEVIQAIGRLRAVRHDHQVDVYAYGGVPLLDMEAQGFTMAYEDESSDIGISPEDWNGTVHAATLSKAMRAAALMLDEGLPLESLSSRKLNHQLKSGQNLLDHAAFCRGMPSSTALDTYVAKIDGRGTSSKTSTEVVALVKSVAREKASTDPMLEESVTGEQYVRWPVIPGARCAPGHAGRE